MRLVEKDFKVIIGFLLNKFHSSDKYENFMKLADSKPNFWKQSVPKYKEETEVFWVLMKKIIVNKGVS